MRLVSARIRGFRSVVDSGTIDFEQSLTVLVGPSDSGKSTLLRGIHLLNPSEGSLVYDPLRDYPRRSYVDDILRGGVDRDGFSVVEGHFAMSPTERGGIPQDFRDVSYLCGLPWTGAAGTVSSVPRRARSWESFWTT
ncbi:MAG: AAA family ATPase [Deltaproteobacteria bacterium]|jgi:energy-coupling factor transporter ATP-binding protein EcfA2|nr:AAA family ATPase [Deltaproteobacteria bacterium]